MTFPLNELLLMLKQESNNVTNLFLVTGILIAIYFSYHTFKKPELMKNDNKTPIKNYVIGALFAISPILFFLLSIGKKVFEEMFVLLWVFGIWMLPFGVIGAIINYSFFNTKRRTIRFIITIFALIYYSYSWFLLVGFMPIIKNGLF